MHLGIKLFRTALAVSCLAVAACGNNGAVDLQSSQNSNAKATSALQAAAAGATSPSGTTIPSATQIIDASGNVWIVLDGVIYENGALAGYSNDVTLLLYFGDTMYQQNSAGGWWSWNGTTWVASSDPRTVRSSASVTSSPNGTTIPSATQILDAGGNVWTVAADVVYENGTIQGFSDDVILLLYYNATTYKENAYSSWWSWNGSTWVAGSDPRPVAYSPSGTTIPSATQITDAGNNVWTLTNDVVYENGAVQGFSDDVTLLLYYNATIYKENAYGSWWSWNGTTWVAGSDPVAGLAPTITGSPPTSDLAGDAYSFVPTSTNPGGGAFVFTVANLPAWATFDPVTGAVSGTPDAAQAGTYSNIIISVSNGSASASIAPFSISVTTTGSASLSWTAPTQNVDGTPLTDLAGYTIYYGTDPGVLNQSIQLFGPGATSDVVGNLSPGTYYFAVAAYTTQGTQSALSTVASKTID